MQAQKRLITIEVSWLLAALFLGWVLLSIYQLSQRAVAIYYAGVKKQEAAQELNKQRTLNEKLWEQVERLKNNPSYIEKEAHAAGMTRWGEILLRPVPPVEEGIPPVSEESPVQVGEPLTPWEFWMLLLGFRQPSNAE